MEGLTDALKALVNFIKGVIEQIRAFVKNVRKANDETGALAGLIDEGEE